VLSDNYHDIEAGIVGWLMVLALIAGFSCGFFVDDVREFGVEIRNWLAWNV